jgi:hypothetical protein
VIHQPGIRPGLAFSMEIVKPKPQEDCLGTSIPDPFHPVHGHSRWLGLRLDRRLMTESKHRQGPMSTGERGSLEPTSTLPTNHRDRAKSPYWPTENNGWQHCRIVPHLTLRFRACPRSCELLHHSSQTASKLSRQDPSSHIIVEKKRHRPGRPGLGPIPLN